MLGGSTVNLLKIFGTITLGLAFLTGVIFLIVAFIQPIPQDVRNNVILIVLISLGCVILLVLLFLTPFGFGNINELIKFAQALKVLKEDDVQKSLSELNELPNIIKMLRMAIINKLKIVEDYTEYLKKKTVRSMLVLGASLETPNRVKTILEDGTRCEYLCVGNKEVIEDHARAIVKCLGTKSDEYIKSEAIKIYCIESHPVQFPRTFYNSDEDDAEVLIFFPNEIENIIGKYAILLKNEVVIRKWKDEYIGIRERYLDTGNILTKFITRTNEV